MRRPYVKPALESEEAFEALAGGCTFMSPDDSSECDPELGGVIFFSAGWPWP